MRVTMEDVWVSLAVCIFVIGLYANGWVNAMWGASLVAIWMVLVFFKCKLELCYITKDQEVYNSKKRRKKRVQ